jgi:hypothetical protein
MEKKYFPIKTATACALKWSWTTLYLNTGVSATCHRTSKFKLTPENFSNFHNNSVVLEDRRQMLEGQWPETNCSYCRNIEQSGGVSDRMIQLELPDHMPLELEANFTALEVSPTIVEVFFDNTCNLGCLYCNPNLSSTIANENKKFGEFKKDRVHLQSVEKQFKNLIPHFWLWFDTGFKKLKRFGVLGGEPFLLKEFDILLDKIEKNGNPDCVLYMVSNLMISKTKLEHFVNRFRHLLITKKIKRVDISCSIDCWGIEQEYVRWGLDLVQWEQNFNYLLTQKWLTININQTISALTIKTMPELLTKLNLWNKQRPVGHWFGGVSPGPSYMKAEIFGNQEFQDTFDEILCLMPTITKENKNQKSYMAGIITQIKNSTVDLAEIKSLITYLDEKDCRRGTSWKNVFPWLEKYVV